MRLAEAAVVAARRLLGGPVVWYSPGSLAPFCLRIKPAKQRSLSEKGCRSALYLMKGRREAPGTVVLHCRQVCDTSHLPGRLRGRATQVALRETPVRNRPLRVTHNACVSRLNCSCLPFRSCLSSQQSAHTRRPNYTKVLGGC